MITERVDGMTKAAPKPMMPRQTISGAGVAARDAARVAAPKTTSPNNNARRRPKRSPSAPAVSRKPANTSG